MKKFYYLLFVAFSALFSACDSPVFLSEKTSIYMLVDNTEKSESSDRENLLPTESVMQMMQNGGKITMQEINSTSINSTSEMWFSIPDDATGTLIEMAKRPFIEKFEIARKELLGESKKGTELSSIYKPICEAIEKMKSDTASKKVLIVVSDMIEHSQFGNFYHELNIEKVKKSLNDSSGAKLQNIPGLKIIILYSPEGDPKKERQFDKAIKYWKVLFKDAGITWEKRAKL